jgi:hypothetical protein
MLLPVNPPGSTLGSENAVLSGTGKRTFRLDETSYLILNDRQRYSIAIESHRPVQTFCLFFERGYVEDIHRATVNATGTLLDAPDAAIPGKTAYFEALRPVSAELRGRLLRFARGLPQMSPLDWDERFS